MIAVTKLISRSVTPPAFMMAPASTNIGIAIRANFVEPSYMSNATLTRLPMPSLAISPMIAEIAKATAIGTLRQIMKISATKISNINIVILPQLFEARFQLQFQSRRVQSIFLQRSCANIQED